MDNLTANAQGVADVNIHLAGVTLGGGAANDIAGRAVIVHAAPDDYTSQPPGHASARVACGITTTPLCRVGGSRDRLKPLPPTRRTPPAPQDRPPTPDSSCSNTP